MSYKVLALSKTLAHMTTMQTCFRVCRIWLSTLSVCGSTTLLRDRWTFRQPLYCWFRNFWNWDFFFFSVTTLGKYLYKLTKSVIFKVRALVWALVLPTEWVLSGQRLLDERFSRFNSPTKWDDNMGISWECMVPRSGYGSDYFLW